MQETKVKRRQGHDQPDKASQNQTGVPRNMEVKNSNIKISGKT